MKKEDPAGPCAREWTVTLLYSPPQYVIALGTASLSSQGSSQRAQSGATL